MIAPTQRLVDLAAEIHWHQQQSQVHAVAVIHHKVEIGLRLIAAKELLCHGQFLKWAEREFGWKRTNVERHMLLARNYPRVGNLPEHTSLRMALAAVAARDGSDNVHFSSGSDEWYTPQQIIERTVTALGAIDLDPCSNPENSVPAATHFTRETDGLAHEWHGRVYMNPPYGDEISDWVRKLTAEYSLGHVDQAIALVPARVDTEWFQQLRDCTICFVRGRLKFSGARNSAPFPSAVVYVGTDMESFHRAFADLGDIWVRWEPPIESSAATC